MKRLSQFIIFIIVLPLLWTLRLVPLRVSERMGRGIMRFLGPRISTQKTVLNNISIVFPNNTAEENIALSKKLWVHVGINLSHALQLDNEDLIHNTKITGIENIQKEYDNGNGVILISAHIGVWDIVAINVKHQIAPCDVVYRPIENPFLNTWIEKFRLKVYNKLIVKSPSAGRAILRSLKQGNIIPMLSDQKMWGHTKVRFFGKDAECADGAVRMGYKTSTPVIPVRSKYTPQGYELVFEPAMILTGDLMQDTLQMNAIFERWVLETPEQYYNFTHKKWD